MPILCGGDKNNINLTNRLQVMQNNAASKINSCDIPAHDQASGTPSIGDVKVATTALPNLWA